jgi:hypothetical protein
VICPSPVTSSGLLLGDRGLAARPLDAQSSSREEE